jgi:hypothetical protein
MINDFRDKIYRFGERLQGSLGLGTVNDLLLVIVFDVQFGRTLFQEAVPGILFLGDPSELIN